MCVEAMRLKLNCLLPSLSKVTPPHSNNWGHLGFYYTGSKTHPSTCFLHRGNLTSILSHKCGEHPAWDASPSRHSYSVSNLEKLCGEVCQLTLCTCDQKVAGSNLSRTITCLWALTPNFMGDTSNLLLCCVTPPSADFLSPVWRARWGEENYQLS